MPLRQTITLAPELPSPPAYYIPLSDLEEALFFERLGGKPSPEPLRRSFNRLTKRWHWGRKLAPIEIRKVKWACASDLLISLRSGELITVCHVASTGTYYRMPVGFWNSQYAGLMRGGTLWKYKEVRVLPEAAYGNQIYVHHQNALKWLRARGITEQKQSFPDLLRRGRRISAPAKPPDDEVIIRQLEKLINEEGLSTYEAAKKIKTVPGFEGVGTVLARELVKGIKAPGRPANPR